MDTLEQSLLQMCEKSYNQKWKISYKVIEQAAHEVHYYD
jgi:hypothetical protein